MQKEKYKKILSCKRFLFGSWIILFVAILFAMIFAICNKPVGCDSSYYLSYANEIAMGLTPYTDFTLMYTPLFMYIVAGVKTVFSISNDYSVDLLFWYILVLANALLMYELTKEIVKNKCLSVISSFVFLFASLRCDGLGVLLEMPSVFWGLIGLLLLIKYSNWISTVFAGIFAFCSFFTKQYGLGFFVLFVLYLILEKRYKHFLLLLISFTLALVLSVKLVGKDCLNVLFVSYSGYDERHGFNYICEYVIKYGKAWLKLFRILPVFLLSCIVFIIHLCKKQNNMLLNKKNTIVCLGILGFLLQFIFGPFYHYYIYVIPFASIFSVWVLSNVKNRNLSIFWIFVLLITISFNYFRICYNGLFVPYKGQIKQEQLVIANDIKSIVGTSNNLLIAEGKLMPQYYLTGILPADYDYSFGSYVTNDDYIRRINISDYLLIEQNSETFNTVQMKEIIKRDFVEVKQYADYGVLYKRNVLCD